MKWTILLLAALMPAASPTISMARNRKLKALNIHTVYVYSSLVHSGDTLGQEEAAWVKQAHNCTGLT